jgi:arabinogalactan oligomer/maltooligosaccharide transport system substrate-binding protein
VTDAVSYLNDLYQISKENGWSKNDADGLAPFTEGTAVAITNGNWAMGDYKKALGDKLGVAPLPAGPAGPATPMLGVDGFYFNPNSANKEAALDVALYLTNKNSQTVMMNEAGHVPVRTDVEITDPLIQGLVDAFNQGATVRPQVAELGKYWANFCGTDQVFEAGTPAEEWVTAGTTAANQ